MTRTRTWGDNWRDAAKPRPGHLRRRHCPTSGKLMYLSDYEAQLMLDHVRAQRGADAVKVETSYYQCPDCQTWHLTSREQRPKRRNRRKRRNQPV